ncbi:hypothetical protein [Parasitella parasitica]|uniref:Ricin B lectin domain-containing protein n=1 Tax=Parasitella parasitica TaxID=35722 RepID=A0A0B7MWI0_9FUNG|nr:hypothetical protein [Parasitella parasitica]
MATFPKGWFFIKNQNNGYVLSTEKSSAGESVVIATMKSKDFDTQLWQYGEDERLHNKKTGFVLDIRKGLAKAGSDVVQQNESDSSECQKFALSSEGHIYLKKDQNLVLGIKESFFTRREGQHVHLQSFDKNIKDSKEQRWDFFSPSQKRSISSNNAIDSLKRTISGASLGSFSSSSTNTHGMFTKMYLLRTVLTKEIDDDGCLDDSHHNQLSNFPDTEFFIKSDSTGYFVGVDAAAVNSPGARLSLEPLRKNNYESQLWHYDVITGRLINKNSGFTLSAEEVADESLVCQSSSTTDKDLPCQSWNLSDSGEIRLKHEQHSFVLGYKKDSWFGLNREGSPVLLQKQADGKTHSHQRFVVVLPVFKKKTTEIVNVTEQQGVFPEGYFFIKNQKHGLVISVLETDKLAAEIIASNLDTRNFNRQLWKHSDGFLINKASNLVLDVRGGCIEKGAELCQYKQKQTGFENQQWGLSVEGFIHAKTHKTMVLSIASRKDTDSNVFLTNKKTPDHEEQRWNFVLPVFKQKSTTVTETTVKKSVSYHHYAQYPSGWFFIRSFIGGSSTDAPLVLTAESNSSHVVLSKINKQDWQYQLWMYWNGVLINFATQLAIDVVNDNINAGSVISQEVRKAGDVGQRWSLTVDGYLVHGSNPSLTLVPQVVEEGNYKLCLADHISSSHQDNRWGLLSPEVKIENNTQVLVRWSVTLLTEWKKTTEQTIQKVVHRIADWPQDTFFISAQDGLALAPEKSEAFSFVVVKKLELGQSEHFKWAYRNGYVVHVATGLVLHAADDLVGGSQLQIREELLADSKTIDQRQKWVIKTDGSIVSELKTTLGFALIQQSNQYMVQLAYTSNTSEHYSWGFVRGHYESRYSQVYKKEMSVVTRTERILLTVRTQHVSSNANTKLVAHSYGVFPENWFYIRSKEDKTLVLTAPSRKEGAKLTLSKLDYKIFRRQLWHTQDNGCLVNLESDLVIDVAGGAFNIGSDIIQWHEKYLRRHRKNQLWGLSVEGHLHPKSRPGLVLGAKGNKVFDGAEVQLHARGALDLNYQQWTFATPIFGRTISGVKGVSAAGVLEENNDSVFIDSVDEASFKTSTTDRYERKTKLTVVRRWGLFPEGGFFIRAGYGDEHLALTVEKRSRTGEDNGVEHEVTLRPINFKEYQWHFWAYQEGHLINLQTGLALDARTTKGLLVEDGLRNPLFVREKSMSETQFWSLTAEGEIFLRSDQHLVIGVSNSRRVSVSGAQVGIRELRVRKLLNEKGQQETSIKSEKWLKWVFSKPVYRKTTTTTTTTTTSSTSVTAESAATAAVGDAGEIVEGLEDQQLGVKQKEESADDYTTDEDDDSSSDSGSDDDQESNSKKLNLIGNLGIATAGAGILAGTAGMITDVITSAPESISTAVMGKKTKEESSVKQSLAKKTSYKSLRNERKDSFHVSADYVPTGFEKVVRYKTHQQPNFPTAGYFMIKSHLHGYVFDIANGEAKDGAFVVLSPIRTTDFASQLWSYKDGRVFNLKGHNLVLDASMTDTITAGERLVISVQKSSLGLSDQYWEFGTEGGLICLKSKRNLVLGVKELKRATDQNASVDVYLQEEKSHLKSNVARPEQRWEIKVPAMIPVEQTTNTTTESKYTIIEGGKISAISSSVSAVIAFKWLKETFHHKVTANNQWPSSQNWFFIRIGNENAFLSSGSVDSSEVKFVSLGQNEDHKQFLWVYVNGYLVNYKYMLRLVYDKQSNKLLLSSDTKTLDQAFCVSSQGNLSVKIQSETTYFTVASAHFEHHSYELVSSTVENATTEAEHSLQLHVPVFSDVEVEKESKIALSTVTSWIESSQKTSSTTTTTTTTTTTKVSQFYGVFPVGTWFFIKAQSKEGDSLVLAVKDSSSKSGASLILKKLNFKDYRSQLWTFRNGLLINYGSKLVIDVNGEINEYSKLIQSNEAGVSTQKWSLTADGYIQLDSYAQYTFGYTLVETIAENIEVVLVAAKSYEASSTTQAICWRFSVPVFGKAASSTATTTTTTTTVTTTVSSIERITACIEQGALIESVEEADIKVEDISVKKNNAVNETSSSTTASVAKEKHHGFQDVLTSVGIAVTAGVVAVGAVQGASKVAEKISEHKQEKKAESSASSSSSTAAVVKQDQKQEASSTTTAATTTSNTVSAVTDSNKATETIVVRRSRRTSVQIIQESRSIIRAWKIVFSQRVHHCKTKEELVQTIEESRQELFRRLDEHLRVHASVDHLISGTVPEWHVSIQQVKELYRARVFDRFLDRLSHQEVTDVTSLDFDSTLSSATQEVENHYSLVIEHQTKILSESTSSTVQKTQQCQDVSIQEDILVTIDTIKVTVRYWFISLYETISTARNKGSSEEEIKVIIENSRKELTNELATIKASATGHIEKSSSTLLTSKQTSISNTIQTAITQTENTVNTQISTVCSEKKYLYAEEHWLDVTRVTEETLSGQLKVYQTAIIQEISEVQKTEVDKSDQAEISVVLDEKMVAVAQQTVANKLTETQIKLSSWYTEVTQQISWLLEESKTSPNGETVKQDTLAIVDAAQVEINTRIEETKLVVRAYYAHLTYLSWAERRRIEYALDSIKASLTASITQFKKSIEKSEVTNEDIVRYTSYSFGATASRIVLTDLQTIVVKVINVKETTTIVNKSDEIQAEKTKIALTQGTAAAVTKEKVTEVTKTTAEQVDVTKKAESSKVDQVKKTEKVNVDQQTKIVDKIESEVEQTKVSKDDNNKQSSSNTTTVVDNSQKSSESGHGKAAVVSTAVIGAAAAAIAGAAIIHHHEGKATESKSEVAVNVPAVEQPAKASVIVGNKAEEEAIQVGKQTTASSTTTVSKQEKSETLVVVYDQVQVTVQEWITTLNKRVYECAQKKSSTTQQEIDTIVYESQQQLIVEIEKAKRNTTAVIGTSQTSFHDTLSWVRSTVWKQAVEVKRIGYEIASSTTTDTSTSHFQEKLETLKQTTLQKVDVEIEKSKKSASVIHVVGHEHAAVIAAGKKFEGVDYSKSSCGASIEKTKVTVGILIEDTRVTVQRLLRDLHLSITERRKQGGENVQADIDVIVKKHREEINAYIVKSKTEFEQRITSVHEASSTTTEVSSSVDVELTKETVKKVNTTLEQIQESVLVQVTKVEQVTTSTTITSQVEYEEKLTAITHEACQKLDATLAVSETVIGHHIEVIAESSAATKSSTSTTVTTEAETKESKQVSLGVEYGLLIVSETTKNVSSQISALIEQVHHRITLGSESLETDIHGYVTNSDKELDLIFEEAKTKISYELSMVASHEKVEEEHFIEHLESIRTSAKTRISQIQTVATTVHKEESKTVSEKLLQIAEESRHEVTAHYESIKQSIFKKTEKKTQAADDSTAATKVVVSHTEEQKKQQEQKKQEEHKSSVDLAKKVLVGSAAVAAGTAIAVEVAKKLNEHKEKTAKIEHTEKETAIVVEDVKIQFNKWISTLTETVVTQSKQSQVSTEEISVTIEKSKAEFLEVIKKAKSSEVITEKHQHQVLTWIEETAVAQASRIQEIAVHSSTSSAIDIESKLQVIKISTSQEVDIALEKCKSTKSTVSEYVGVTVEQLKQKEAALLDIRSELAIVVQDVRSSLVTFFEKFSKSVVARLEQGGETIEKDLAILIANTRKELSIHVETVKATATKRLSALETKSSTTVISTAALSGIATAEIIAVLKSSEQLLEQKINRVHSSVWYLEKNQDVTKIVETITTIQTETTVEITEKVESSHYGFVTAINDHHKAGHVSTDVIKHTTAAQAEHHEAVLKASLSVQEVKITIREWLRTLAEKVSVCSQKGGSSEEIDAIVQKENQVIFEYLDQSATKISESVKAEESIKHLHTTVEQVKATITKTSTEIKVIGVEASTTTSHSYGGFDKMTSVITQHEHQISEALVVYEQKITKQTSESTTTTTTSSEAAKKTTTAVSKKDTYTVVAVEYILSTVQTWMQELMVEVSECAKVEHNVQIATKMINSIVTEYREYINVEFAMITERIQSSKSDATAKQELINMLEWTRGVILQSSTQVQSIGINCASSFSATGGIEQMKPLVNASWDQVKLTVERCNKTIKIDVERTSAHSEKKKVKSDCQKQEIQKKAECLAAEKKKKEEACAKKASKKDSDSSDSDSGSDSDTKKKQKKAKKDCAKKKGKSTAGKKKAQKSPDSDSSDDDSASDSERNDSKKKKKIAVGIIAGGVAGAIIKAKHDDSDSDSESDSGSDTDSNSGSSSGSDSDGSKKTTVVDKKKLATGEATLDVTVIVREWYEKLIVDVSNRSKKGGSSASADIEIIVQKATKSITETLRIISVNAHKSVSDKTTVTQYQASIEWAKNLVIQSSYTIKAIGINTAASASSKTGGIEQMRPIAVSIQEQINVEIRRYKLVVQQIEQVAKKDTAVSVIEHKQNNEKICTGRQSAVNRKDYCDKLEKHVSEVVAESKVVIVSWFAQLIREVSIRVHQGGSNVEQDVAALIVKAKLELSSTIERTKNKLSSSIEVYEKDKTFALVEYHIHESLKTVQTTVDSKITQVQEIVTKHHSESEVTEKLSVVLEASKVDITETLESTHTQSVTVIKQETTQTESTVKIIDTVDTVKTAVAHWHTKLSEEIHAISIDTTTTITEKEQRISTLIQEATVEIQRVTVEAKSTVTLESSSVKKISKSKEQELLATIDYVHETFAANVKKIQEVSIEAVSKTETTNIKESISTVIRTSHEKIDTALTRTTATVIGAATAAIAVHAASKQDKKQQETKSSEGKLSVDVDENVTVISKWFELFTKRVSGSVVHKTDESVDVVQNVTAVTEHAEQEITEIISTARNDFVKRLSLQNLDQESYNYACKHYEESLESVRVSIVTQIVEVKKVAIHAHTTGNVQELEAKLTKLSETSNERIKVAMGSSVVISHKAQSGAASSCGKKAEAVVQIKVKEDDAIVVGDQDIEFGRKESTTTTSNSQEKTKKSEKAEEKKKDSNIDKIVAGTLAIGAAAGAAVLINKKNEKEDVVSKTQDLKYDSGITTIDSVNISISAWFTSLIQKVSMASRVGASSKKITSIVQESRNELTQIIEHAKVTGGKYCASASDEQQFISKIEWASSVAHNQAVQIQQIGINSSGGKADMTGQMQALATASYHQIEVTLEQLKTSVTFHQKINKINTSKTQQTADTSKTEKTTSAVEKPVCGNMATSVDKTKVAYTVIQETRATTIAMFVSLSERIVIRIRQGGSNVQEDVNKMIASSEQEVTKIFAEAKSTTSKVDKKTRLEIEQALSSVHKTVQEEITQVKVVTTEVVSSETTDTKVAVEKVLQVSKTSKSKIETTFTSVSESIAASLIIVSQTAQQATETVQGWFSDLKNKIDKLLEAGDCSEEETQQKINVVVAEAEVEMKAKIEKLQQTATTTTTSTKKTTTQVTTDHHLDIFFGNIKSSVQSQLDVVKTAVQDTSKTDKSKIMSAIETSETKLQQEVKNHYEAVEKITTVEHITGSKQQETTAAAGAQVEKQDRHDSYKDTIVKTAVGSAAVAAAAAIAIDYHKKNQQAETTAVQVVNKTSIQDVQVQIDTWFTRLSQKVTACTKKGGSNVSVEVDKIVKEAQAELEVTINQAKTQHTATTTTTTTTSESSRTFVSTLEWIKVTAYSQSTQITQIVSQGSSSSIDLTTQIENHVSATKQQVDSALEVHYNKKESTSSTVVSENIVQVVKESRQQTQKRFSLETTVIVQESKTHITNWLVLLLENITSIIHGNSETIRKDIFARLDVAEKELDVFIKQTKDKFLMTSNTSATSHVETETQTLVVNSVKQTLDCIDSIKATLLVQISVLREVINRIEVEDIDVITERLEAVITRTQKRVHHTLEVGVDLAISSAFEGKVVTWSETLQIPASFKDVRVIAFDVLGTVANYRKNLYQVWKQVTAPKNDLVLASFDFDLLVREWYGAYIEIKRENFAKKRPVSDGISLHESLVHILKRNYLKDTLSEAEIEQLCAAWQTIGVYDDASIGIRRLKNQVSAKYATIAISDTLSTRSLIDLAQSNCLCWHGQFTAEMFASQQQNATASQSVVKGTIELLGLERASQLAIVSSSSELIAAAKKEGCHTVLIEREECCAAASSSAHKEAVVVNEVDIKVDGLDVFGESVQSFLEHESMVQVWNEKGAPAAPRVLVQQLKRSSSN